MKLETGDLRDLKYAVYRIRREREGVGGVGILVVVVVGVGAAAAAGADGAVTAGALLGVACLLALLASLLACVRACVLALLAPTGAVRVCVPGARNKGCGPLSTMFKSTSCTGPRLLPDQRRLIVWCLGWFCPVLSLAFDSSQLSRINHPFHFHRKICFLKENEVKCMKIFVFHRHLSKSRSIFVINHLFFEQICDFQGLGRREGTHRHTGAHAH